MFREAGSLAFLNDVFAESAELDAILDAGQTVSYGALLELYRMTRQELVAGGLQSGAVVALEADFTPKSIAALLAVVDCGAIAVPLAAMVPSQRRKFSEIAEVELRVTFGETEGIDVEQTGRSAGHEHYAVLRARKHPGLVLFSSGSTGEPKAAVHDLTGILEKFHVRRQRLRTITFLLYDHIGGLNTLFYTLSNGGAVVTVRERHPDVVLGAIEEHGVELLPTSPTFLNLVLVSGALERHDVSSLRLVTYGTEPMPELTLKAFHEQLPEVRLQQTYGLSELGILRSKSRSADELWVKVGGEGYETRIVDGILHIRAQSAMLGYLNAPSPFDAEGWMNTGDEVEVDGDYLRILGRRSEVINVGGEKVYPAPVEGFLESLDVVAQATVYAEPHPLVGQIVCARIRPTSDEPERTLRQKIKRACQGQLPRYQIPSQIVFDDAPQHGERVKKSRG